MPCHKSRAGFLIDLLSFVLCASINAPASQAIAQTYSSGRHTPHVYGSREVIFGETGESGENGQHGRPGITQNPQTIRLFRASGGQPYYDLTGTRGEDGAAGVPGRRARHCHVSRPSVADFLVGANGGNGGDGGNGGNGGNGSDASIYYTDLSQLQTLVIENAGGRGGQPGRGARGGEGCEYLGPYYLGSDEYKSGRHEHTQYIEYQDGEFGQRGSDGRAGVEGSYGSIRLIPRKALPEETIFRTDSLNTLLGKTTELVQNIWVERQGLRSLLHTASDVRDRYTYLQSTERLNYRLEWAAAESPVALGVENVAVGAAIHLDGANQSKLDFTIPGTLDYTITKDTETDTDVITVTGGFSPDRVRSFQVANVLTRPEESQLVLVDEGQLNSLLDSTIIEITCLTNQSASGLTTDTYQRRHSLVFDTAANSLDNSQLRIDDHTYTLYLGEAFQPWLRPGSEVIYEISIHQTTRRGIAYSQTETVSFQVSD